MTSKWIEDLEDVYADGGEWDDFLPRLLEIDKLLRRSMFSTDDEALSFDILNQMDKLDVVVTRPGVAVGVSSVIPVTNEEAERIFKEAEENGD